MSEKLLVLVKNFLDFNLDVEFFIGKFIAQWKSERDNKTLLSDSPEVSEVLSSIFCLVDLYNADNDRESYELNDSQLKIQIKKTLEKGNFF